MFTMTGSETGQSCFGDCVLIRLYSAVMITVATSRLRTIGQTFCIVDKILGKVTFACYFCVPLSRIDPGSCL